MQAWQMILIDSILFALLVLTLCLLALRHKSQQMLHEERLAALEKGADLPKPEAPAPWSPRVYLLRGLIWTFGGVALIVCLLGLAVSSEGSEAADTMAWRAKSVSETLDIPMDQARRIVEKDSIAHARGVPVTIAFLGMIPLAVGLAYLVYYHSDPSRKLGRELVVENR